MKWATVFRLLLIFTFASDANNFGCWIEPPNIARIACDDAIAALSREKDHGCVDHIRGIGRGAEFTACARQFFVERNNLHLTTSQETGKVGLTATIAPHLADDAGGNSKRVASCQYSID